MIVEFKANSGDAFPNDYGKRCVVHGVYLTEDTDDVPSQSWNVTRASLEEENEGVCTVKEIQQAMFYGDIESFTPQAELLTCIFTVERAAIINVETLIIRYELTDELWQQICEQARLEFTNRPDVRLIDAA